MFSIQSMRAEWEKSSSQYDFIGKFFTALRNDNCAEVLQFSYEIALSLRLVGKSGSCPDEDLNRHES